MQPRPIQVYRYCEWQSRNTVGVHCLSSTALADVSTGTSRCTIWLDKSLCVLMISSVSHALALPICIFLTIWHHTLQPTLRTSNFSYLYVPNIGLNNNNNNNNNHNLAIIDLGHLLARSGLTHPEMSLQWSPMVHSTFCFVSEVLKDKTIKKYILFHNVTKCWWRRN